MIMNIPRCIAQTLIILKTDAIIVLATKTGQLQYDCLES